MLLTFFISFLDKKNNIYTIFVFFDFRKFSSWEKPASFLKPILKNYKENRNYKNKIPYIKDGIRTSTDQEETL
jgi:hypothetical protein